MQKILFIIIFSFFFNTLKSQTIETAKTIADIQFENKNYKAALKEYQRVYFFDNQNKFSDIYVKIAQIYESQHNYNESVKFYNYAFKTESNDSLQSEYVINKAKCYLKQNNFSFSLNELMDMPKIQSDYVLDKQNLYLAISHFGLNEFKESEEYFLKVVDSIGVIQIQEKFSSLSKFNKRFNPDKIEKMSRILPGLGQFYVGDIKNGINSIVLISGIMYYAIHTAITYSYVDGGLILVSWFNRYYSGGYKKARHAAEHKIESKKSHIYEEIILIIEEHQKNKNEYD